MKLLDHIFYWLLKIKAFYQIPAWVNETSIFGENMKYILTKEKWCVQCRAVHFSWTSFMATSAPCTPCTNIAPDQLWYYLNDFLTSSHNFWIYNYLGGFGSIMYREKKISGWSASKEGKSSFQFLLATVYIFGQQSRQQAELVVLSGVCTIWTKAYAPYTTLLF